MQKSIVAVPVILLWLSAIPSAAVAAGDPGHGKALFSRCAACHAINGQSKIGPPLDGVVGRKAGSVESFTRYSQAMKASKILWSEQTLDAFLAAPTRTIPGTMMASALPKEQDRADVIAYLKTLAHP